MKKIINKSQSLFKQGGFQVELTDEKHYRLEASQSLFKQGGFQEQVRTELICLLESRNPFLSRAGFKTAYPLSQLRVSRVAIPF